MGGGGGSSTDGGRPGDGSACGQVATDPKNCGRCGNDCSTLPHVKAGAAVQCVAGKCVVPSTSCEDGYLHCTASADDVCETAITRPEACGACDKACPAAAPLCVRGASGYSCAGQCSTSSPDKCSASCVNLKTDVANCGTCGNDCRALANVGASTCEAGVCKITSCRAGFGDCTAEPGCETSLVANQSHCGKCGQACAVPNATSTCADSKCSDPVCVSGAGNCDKSSPDCETQLNTSANCGACGVTCSGATPACVATGGRYACASDCPASAPDKCGTACVDLKTDRDRCGSCTQKCQFANAEATCAAGACQLGRCNPGFADCNRVASDGCETPLGTGINCSACGDACAFANSTSSCVGGKCTTPVCADGFGNCNASSPDCETQLNTRDNCGRCANRCGDDVPVCSTATGAGQCTTGCSSSAPTRCGSVCTNVASDDNNCGSCNSVCNGRCQSSSCIGIWDKSNWNGGALWAP